MTFETFMTFSAQLSGVLSVVVRRLLTVDYRSVAKRCVHQIGLNCACAASVSRGAMRHLCCAANACCIGQQGSFEACRKAVGDEDRLHV